MSKSAPLEDRVRSALFVDFDNVYSGLRRVDHRAAERFATEPGRWVDWLAGAEDRPGAAGRRFLVRYCYMNPEVYSRYRGHYSRNGFQVVDCPPLTKQGKTSADIQIVLDVLDTLTQGTRVEEFVIASADADFTPLLRRIRAVDRQTTVLTAGPVAAAYMALADWIVAPEPLLRALGAGGGGRPGASSTRTTAPVHPAATAAVLAVRQAVAASPVPLPGSAAALAATRAEPSIAENRWGGAGTFAGFVERHLPELVFERSPGPGFLRDPRRHSC